MSHFGALCCERMDLIRHYSLFSILTVEKLIGPGNRNKNKYENKTWKTWLLHVKDYHKVFVRTVKPLSNRFHACHERDCLGLRDCRNTHSGLSDGQMEPVGHNSEDSRNNGSSLTSFLIAFA